MRKILMLLKIIFTFPFRIRTKVSPLSILRGSTFMKTSAISAFCNVYNSDIGKYSYLGRNTSVYHTTIGNFTSIADGCIIGPGSHPLDRLSTSPVFYIKHNIFRKNFAVFDFEDYKETIIGNDVWIGTNVFIKSGVTIGNGAVIGACSVVTKDVEPYSIVAGNPAKFIKKRFNNAIIKEVIAKEWWNWSDEKIQNNIELFTDSSFTREENNSDRFSNERPDRSISL